MKKIVVAHSQTTAGKVVTALESLEPHAERNYLPVGVGGALCGIGAELIILCGELVLKQEAESKVVQEKCRDWFRNDLQTRLMPDAEILNLSEYIERYIED
jgi:hypothetical protein